MRSLVVKVLAVVGPTASGKSALAMELCRRYGGEIVSCDSMQLYRGMDIGTAKPDRTDRAEIPHHMLDVADPADSYSCAAYASAASDAVNGIAARGHLPVLCGGTGLYLDALIRGSGTADMEEVPGYREELRQIAEREGAYALHAMLADADPDAAASIHPNNVKRVIRALEIRRATGMTKAEWDAKSVSKTPAFDALYLGLDFRGRDELYRRIDRRVDEMIADGLPDEVKRLYQNGRMEEGTTAGQAIGYKEFLPWLRGEGSIADAAEQIKLATRHYAKRQLVWFRRNQDIRWLYPDDMPAYPGDLKATVRQLADAADAWAGPFLGAGCAGRDGETETRRR